MCLPGTAEAVRERVEREGTLATVDRRTVLAGAAATALAAAFPSLADASHRRGRGLGLGHDHGRGKMRMQDLTHVFQAGFPIFGTPPTFRMPSRRTVVTIPANGFYGQEWTFWEHSGTHMDAPGHFIQGGRLSPEITLPELVAPLFVVDVSAHVRRNVDYAVTVDDVRRAERRYGRIPRGALVAMYSGWEERLDVSDPNRFRNPDASGTLHFPGWSGDAVRWLLAERDVQALGVDTLSLDPGNSTTFDAHVTLLGADRYGLENLANLSRVRPRGTTAYVGLVPWEAGSGGPCRVWAAW
ncbi:MAG TPA: cyclase family protein [Gaiellaceae bacterium]|jgi:kynurenine formamidase|nr:cyclase family protein [Gaiellaceae bacterium]